MQSYGFCLVSMCRFPYISSIWITNSEMPLVLLRYFFFNFVMCGICFSPKYPRIWVLCVCMGGICKNYKSCNMVWRGEGICKNYKSCNMVWLISHGMAFLPCSFAWLQWRRHISHWHGATCKMQISGRHWVYSQYIQCYSTFLTTRTPYRVEWNKMCSIGN